MIYGNDNSIDNNSLYYNIYRQINIFYNGSKNINNQKTDYNSLLIKYTHIRIFIVIKIRNKLVKENIA